MEKETFTKRLKSFLKLEEHAEPADGAERNTADDYGVSKSRKFNVITGLISFAVAVVIWLVSVTSGGAVGEQIFNVTPEMRGIEDFVSMAEFNGFTVSMENSSTVSFTLEGRKKSISRVTMDDVEVYVDLNKHIELLDTLPNGVVQTITAEIIIDAPVYFGIDDVSKKDVTIKLIPINKISEE
jgi:hypothetical protein